MLVMEGETLTRRPHAMLKGSCELTTQKLFFHTIIRVPLCMVSLSGAVLWSKERGGGPDPRALADEAGPPATRAAGGGMPPSAFKNGFCKEVRLPQLAALQRNRTILQERP